MNLIEALNSDNENSFLKIWGGEIVYDNFTVVIDKRLAVTVVLRFYMART